MARLFRFLFAAMAGVLLTLNVIALLPASFLGFQDPTVVFLARNDDSTISAKTAWREIDTARKLYRRGEWSEREFLDAMVAAVNRRMANPSTADARGQYAMRPAITDSWLVWALNRDGRFDYFEFQLPRRSLRRGLGTCGAQSITLARLLKQDKFDVVLWGSPVHVVVRAITPTGKTYALDADYGVVVEGARPELDPSVYQLAYEGMLQVGSQLAIPTVLKHYAEVDRVQYDALNGLTERRYSADRYFGIEPITFSRLILFVEWAIPILLIVGAVAPWRLRFKRPLAKG